MTIKINGTNTTAQPSITGADTDTGLVYGTDEVQVVTGGTTRATVDSSGRVGIGTAAPASLLDVHTTTEGNVARFRASDDVRYLQISSFNAGANGSGYDFDATSSSGALSFSTTGSEALRIDSGGKLLLQKAQQFQYNTASTDSRTWYLNNDIHAYGDFAFRRSTTQTGSTFETKILFKDTGGICFNGDTAAANALDDYEEGTWTPVCVGRTTNGSTSNNRTAVGRYRKIGSVVHVMLDVDQTLSGAAGDFQINGLPFTAHSGPYVRFAGPVIFFNPFGSVTWSGSLVSYINDGGSVIWLRGNQSGSSSHTVASGNGRREIALNMTYYVDG